MPTYQFQWTGEVAPTQVELPDDHAACGQAITTTGEILRELDGSFPVPGEFEMVVREAGGDLVLSITVRARQTLPRGDGRGGPFD